MVEIHQQQPGLALHWETDSVYLWERGFDGNKWWCWPHETRGSSHRSNVLFCYCCFQFLETGSPYRAIVGLELAL